MRTPPSAVSSTLFSGSREMSISREGRSTSSFIRSIRLVPPAMNFAPGSRLLHAGTDLLGRRPHRGGQGENGGRDP